MRGTDLDRIGLPLADRCVEGMLSEDRGRGRAYFQQGRVTELTPTATGLAALVEGSATYRVEVGGEAAKQGCLHVSCECPRFDDGFNCKHVWATVLAIDAERESWRIEGSNALSIHAAPEVELGEYLDDDDDEAYLDSAPAGATRRLARDDWKRELEYLELTAAGRRAYASEARRRRPKEVLYHLDVERSWRVRMLAVDFLKRELGKSGPSSVIKPLAVSEAELETSPHDEDTELLRLLLTVGVSSPYYGWRGLARTERLQSICVPSVVAELALSRLCATGRFFAGSPPDDGSAIAGLVWDDGPPWSLALEVRFRDDTKRELEIVGWLSREDERVPVSEPLLVLPPGFIVFSDRIARLDAGGHFPWVELLRARPVTIPASDAGRFVEAIWAASELPPLALPPELALEEIRPEPTPWVRIQRASARGRLEATLHFDYGEDSFDPDDHRRGVVRDGKIVVRDRERESERSQRLTVLGLKHRGDAWTLAMKELPRLVGELIADGFAVEAEGIRYRSASSSRFSVQTGIDWLELEGSVDFDGQTADVPEILRAVAHGEGFVRLGDGSHGLLPEAWLARARALTDLQPKLEGDSLRFRPSQALFLDVLLAEQGELSWDADARRLRERLRGFTGIEPVLEPRGFSGELRAYQRDGLGWLTTLSDLGFGGCLADDMGLGKTIQVLALLQLRKLRRRGKRKPSLIVVPRSLVHNWLGEAARFTPRLRVVDYSGVGRRDIAGELDEADVVLTTYGVLRRDVAVLREIALDYAILDEAQAIKNRSSQAAKASRLLHADHRFALTGTPVENHLDELGSIFEFLNPGMLGKVTRDAGRSTLRSTLADAAMLAPALRPFILRRTKGEVLRDLPPKSEQTVYCVLERPQRKLYDELRRHYRLSLKREIDSVGLGRAKIRVIEALLRLRQAACHPGLLDRARADEASAKLERLLEQVSQVVEEGHKALVFSQFTRFLAIVRRRLDARGVTYEYLDGRTRDRKKRVERFQNDEACPLFLISLKAGGLGLNLTAADYVFLLDPWWNPASESQAIDRAHRIGQSRPVFAYRLIAEDTVEEKILELQETKRTLADAIVSENNSLLRELTADDLALLLS